MKNTPVTIKSIAEALNISISTVSRALRDMPEIKAETRAAVQRLAAELDYQPNQLAKNLLHSRTRTIGVLMPNLSYHFYTAMLASIEEEALRAGYSVLVCQSNESHEREIVNMQNLLRSQVEGVLLSVARDSTDYEHITRLTRRNFPLVLFDRYADEIDACKVIIDDQDAAFRATGHLIAQGCRRIGFLAGPANLLISNQRLAGYRAALARHGLPADPAHVLHCDLTPEDASAQTRRLVSLPSPPDGLLMVSNRIAYPAMLTLKQLGVRLPEELALVSFNNEPSAALFSPTLTSVAHPIAGMAREMVRLLLLQIEQDTPFAPETRIFEAELIIRESSAKNRPAASPPCI